MKDRVPNALGIFRLEAGAKARVTVSNEGADGYVVVDGLQILSIEVAREERAGKRPSGYVAIAMVEKPMPLGRSAATASRYIAAATAASRKNVTPAIHRGPGFHNR